MLSAGSDDVVEDEHQTNVQALQPATWRPPAYSYLHYRVLS